MGCDIHFVVEKKKGKKWVGLCSTDYGFRPQAKDRNYVFFGELAGVRTEGSGREPLGKPIDSSELTKECLGLWQSDAHSISHIGLEDFVQCWVKSNGRVETVVKETWLIFDDCLGLYNIMERGYNLKDFRVVFWFDN